jgi:hypothetical protein
MRSEEMVDALHLIFIWLAICPQNSSWEAPSFRKLACACRRLRYRDLGLREPAPRPLRLVRHHAKRHNRTAFILPGTAQRF